MAKKPENPTVEDFIQLINFTKCKLGVIKNIKLKGIEIEVKGRSDHYFIISSIEEILTRLLVSEWKQELPVSDSKMFFQLYRYNIMLNKAIKKANAPN